MDKKVITSRLQDILNKNSELFDEGDSETDIARMYAFSGAVENIIHYAFSGSGSPYLTRIQKLVGSFDSCSYRQLKVRYLSLYNLVEHLIEDIDHGLIDDAIMKAQAMTFDDFLDHAQLYLDEERHMESGVIVGVVFEDTIRKVANKNGIDPSNSKLEQLINALKSAQVFEGTKAKRCKVASDIRGHAAHASWDKYDLSDVKDAMSITRSIITDYLEN